MLNQQNLKKQLNQQKTNEILKKINQIPGKVDGFSKQGINEILKKINKILDNEMILEIITGASSMGLFTIIACDGVEGDELRKTLDQTQI